MMKYVERGGSINMTVSMVRDKGSVLNIGYRRYIDQQNYKPDIEYRVIYRDMVLNTGRQIGRYTGRRIYM